MHSPIPYGKQFISDKDLKAVLDALQSDYLTQGPKIKEFEEAFAKYCESDYAIAVSNGTAALHIAAMSLGVTKGTNVITTPITFAASANCVKYCGGNVYFVDIDPVSFLLDLDKVTALIESKPPGFFSGIIVVDFAGYPANLSAFRALSDKYGLWLIEDACHSPGGFFSDKGSRQYCGNGAYANLSVFSFHPVKHIACGEGGMITTNDAKLYEHLLSLRTHGITRDPAKLLKTDGDWYYEMQELGYNYRLTDFQSALGLSQLERANEGLARRREIAARYAQYFSDKNYISFHSDFHEGHAYHLYVIGTERRKELYDFLKTKKIFCQVHYIPLYHFPYYQEQGYRIEDFPVAEKYYNACLSIPMFPTLTDEEQSYILSCIEEFFG
jgi:UDP-4-amino-4,6-dideoxy-N-acetyl-beta-L-altrosamine transaminase